MGGLTKALVVTIPERITPEQAQRIKDQLQTELGVKTYLIVGASSAVVVEVQP